MHTPPTRPPLAARSRLDSLSSSCGRGVQAGKGSAVVELLADWALPRSFGDPSPPPRLLARTSLFRDTLTLCEEPSAFLWCLEKHPAIRPPPFSFSLPFSLPLPNVVWYELLCVEMCFGETLSSFPAYLVSGEPSPPRVRPRPRSRSRLSSFLPLFLRALSCFLF